MALIHTVLEGDEVKAPCALQHELLGLPGESSPFSQGHQRDRGKEKSVRCLVSMLSQLRLFFPHISYQRMWISHQIHIDLVLACAVGAVHHVIH
jgi:hypothetical protein